LQGNDLHEELLAVTISSGQSVSLQPHQNDEQLIMRRKIFPLSLCGLDQ
jgi:hypothetical protein